VDEPVAGDETVAVNDLSIHAEVAAMVAHEFVGFLERAFVEEQVDARARREFPFLELAGAALFTASGLGRGVARVEFLDAV
jgi:hypothetical protein